GVEGFAPISAPSLISGWGLGLSRGCTGRGLRNAPCPRKSLAPGPVAQSLPEGQANPNSFLPPVLRFCPRAKGPTAPVATGYGGRATGRYRRRCRKSAFRCVQGRGVNFFSKCVRRTPEKRIIHVRAWVCALFV